MIQACFASYVLIWLLYYLVCSIETVVSIDQDPVFGNSSKCIVTMPYSSNNIFTSTYLRNVIEDIHTKSIHNFNDSIALMSKEFLTPDSIRLGCDLYFGPISQYQMGTYSAQKLYYERYLPYFLDCLQPGVVILVSLEWLDNFFQFVYNQIKVPFVLVTGGYSDFSGPGKVSIDHAFSDEKNSNIIYWYSLNCDRNPDPNRFTCIPIGIHDSAISTMGNYAMNAVFARNSPFHIKKPTNTSHDIVVSFGVKTYPNLRRGIWQMFCGGTDEEASAEWSSPFSYTNSNGVRAICFNKVKIMKAYKIIARNKFIISPHGAGLDCYRTWEALLLGAYPVVVKGSLDEMYDDLPVLILDKWDDLTVELLTETSARFASTKYTYEKLYTSYYTYGLFRRFGYPHFKYERTGLRDYSLQVMKDLDINDGDLIRGELYNVYLIRNHKRHPISFEVFSRMGFNFRSIKQLTDMILNDIPTGSDIT